MPHPDMHESWTGGHPDEGLLHEWLDEQLSSTDAARMQAHVASCAGCQARVAEARGLMAASHRILSALDDVPAEVLPPNISSVGAGSANSSNESADVAPRVVSIDTSRATAAQKTKRPVSWISAGKIAAVLILAVTIVKSGQVMRDNTVATLPVAKNESGSGTTSAAATAAAPAPAPVPAAAASSPATGERERMAGGNAASVRDARAGATQRKVDRAAAPIAAPLNAPLNAPLAAAAANDPQPRVMATPPVPLAEKSSVPQQITAQLSGKAAGASVASADAAVQTATAPDTRLRLRSAGAPPVAAAAEATVERRVEKSFVAQSMTPPSFFDSLTLSRTVCGASCELTTVHISAVGDVRYAIGTGNTQRVVMSKLSNEARDTVNALLLRAFPDSTVRVGRVACEQREGRNGAEVQFIIDFRVRIPERAANRCTQSSSQIQRLGAAVDSIVDVSALRQRVPPND